MATRKTGARLITIDGVRYRWRVRHRATYGQSDYGSGTLTCTVELAETPRQLLVLHTSHPHPKDWGTDCAIPFLPRDVVFWVRSAIAAGWAPTAKAHHFTLQAETIQVPKDIPGAVVSLAVALRSGEDCAFALHDALQEAGHPDLADHFTKQQNSQQHPRGCLILRMILADWSISKGDEPRASQE